MKAAVTLSAPAIIVSALILAWAIPVHAVSLSTRYDFKRHLSIIDVVGTFQKNDGHRFMLFIEGLEKTQGASSMVVFNSGGGLLSEAEEIGALIEAHRMMTDVAPDGQCASACVLAWAAGVRKSAPRGVCVGVHQATADATAQLSPTQTIEKAIEATNAEVKWLRAHGAPELVTSELARTQPGDMHCLMFDELMAWGVNITD